jgi:hypothetical protein
MFPAHVAMRQPAQFLVHQRDKSVESRLVTITPGFKQSSHFFRRGCHWSLLQTITDLPSGPNYTTHENPPLSLPGSEKFLPH